MELNLQASRVFQKNWTALNNPETRYIINEGGTRSSKSYSILQCLIVYALSNKVNISIIRQSFPALRGSIMRDFFDILFELELYSEKNHNKTEHIYKFDNGSKIEFFSTDSEQKIRGRKRDILYCNEANELTYDIFLQLKIRTTQKIFIDYNPSDESHFIYDIIKEKDCELIKSTYLDNPFLSEIQIKEIERLIDADEQYYRVYVLGERPTKSNRIYSHFKKYHTLPTIKEVTWGLDLGYNDPTVLVKTHWVDQNQVYVETLIYESKLTTSDLINRLREIGVSKTDPIYCDHRPEVIEEIKRSGFNIKISKKNIVQGINCLKAMQVNIHEDSIESWKEVKQYSWKSKGETILDEVVDINNHFCDSLRYSVYSHKNKGIPSSDFFVFDL